MERNFNYTRIILLVIAIAGLETTVFAQVVQKGTIIEFQLRDVRLNLEEATPVAGHFYLDEEVKPTDVQLKEGLNMDNIMARFNLKDDLMELHIDDYILVLKGPSIAYFDQENRRFTRGSEISDQEVDKDTFYRKIYNGPSSKLFVSEVLTIRAGNYNEALGVGEKADQYVRSKIFHLMGNEGVLLETPSSKKVFKFLTRQNNEAKSYVKSNLIRHDETGLIKLLGFIDSKSG